MRSDVSSEYVYRSAEPTWPHRYLWDPVKRILENEMPEARRVFEIGCGNGATANMLANLGYEVTGVDPSTSGIEVANKAFPHLELFRGSAYDDLAHKYGTFPVVISLEVIEHCYSPRKFTRTLYSLLEPGGLGIISTPYHGYLKNVALALIGRMDQHFTALWDGGHIKFWSIPSLQLLLIETGLNNIRFIRVGRIPPFAKSMIALARK